MVSRFAPTRPNAPTLNSFWMLLVLDLAPCLLLQLSTGLDVSDVVPRMAVQRLLQPEIPNSKLQQDQAVSVVTVDAAFHCIPLHSYLNLHLTQHIPTLLPLTLPILLLHVTALIFCANAQKCILMWPQLVKVVSDEPNRSTCGRWDQNWTLAGDFTRSSESSDSNSGSKIRNHGT